MLRRLRAQVSQVANELPGVLSTSSRNDGRQYLSSSDTSQDNIDDEVEGFLCPICMSTFTAPELLSEHFEEAHNKDKEIEELRIQINEERIYSEEVDRIQSIVAQATDVPHGDVPYLMQQIQVLEAGKSMATQRMLEFEKENVQLKRLSENGQQEKYDIMVKLKQLTGQIRELTDENEGHKRVVCLQVEKEMLSKKLMQPSEDDVAVLRTELIHAQKLMDEISQQKDFLFQAERFIEIEKEIEEERRVSHDRVNKLKEVIRSKEANILETRKQLEERQIEESRQKIEDSIARIADAELKARKLVRILSSLILQESELSQCEAQRIFVLDSESECLNTESDLDFERDRALENKRRFDEALSAMHELGRANQSLQMDISKHTSRAWLDDSAAVNCTSCGKLFSLTVRKHHCRVCGLIFCNPCSSKTAQIASHKNPVRVCDNCFTEVQNR
uniref:FYVE-type domain-containing protein n=1 Tax=Angiostrongylus cantonensis TaxID=6313 RepID=A0A158P9S4_ANGCA